MKISSARIDAEKGRVDNALLKDYSETTAGGATSTATGSAYTVSLAGGNVFNLALTANCAFTFPTSLAAGAAYSFTLILTMGSVGESGGSPSVSWPASVKWAGGSAPTLSAAGKVDIFSFVSPDNGTTWYGFVTGQNFNSIPFSTGLFTFGAGANGGLGLGSAVSRSSPTQVGTSYQSRWQKVSMGYAVGAAIRADGTLWTWGLNSDGQLGVNHTYSRSSPTQVGTLATWASMSTGGQFRMFAIQTDGTLWAWGANNNGQLGVSDYADRSSPTQVGTLATWSRIAGSPVHSLAVKTDGTLWAWGPGGKGQLGINNTASSYSPVQVGTLATWTSAAVGSLNPIFLFGMSLGIKTDGTLWAWGYNPSGQLGVNDIVNRSSPVQVGTLATWTGISAGQYAVLARQTNGTLWAWGKDNSGETGLSSYGYARSSPVQVGTLATWTDVSLTYKNTLARKTDGTLWAWGQNYQGQLGVNDIVNRSSPVQVGTLATWTGISAGGQAAALQ